MVFFNVAIVIVTFIFIFPVKKHNLREPNKDVLSMVSHATEERLRNIIERLSVLSLHRVEAHKVCIPFNFTTACRLRNPQLLMPRSHKLILLCSRTTYKRDIIFEYLPLAFAGSPIIRNRVRCEVTTTSIRTN